LRAETSASSRTMRMTPEDRFDRQRSEVRAGPLITRPGLKSRRTARGLELRASSDGMVGLACFSEDGKSSATAFGQCCAVATAAIWDPRSRSLPLARDHLGLNVVMWHKSRDFRLREHAERPFALDSTARTVRRKDRRFPRAQSRRSCNHVPKCISGPAGMLSA
jgi:hypothetical protein